MFSTNKHNISYVNLMKIIYWVIKSIFHTQRHMYVYKTNIMTKTVKL